VTLTNRVLSTKLLVDNIRLSLRYRHSFVNESEQTNLKRRKELANLRVSKLCARAQSVIFIPAQ